MFLLINKHLFLGMSLGKKQDYVGTSSILNLQRPLEVPGLSSVHSHKWLGLYSIIDLSFQSL